jgi:D-beta-D-heptose 7-phosphate kinase/D-beta-D-heptose 1-phosphate adenosyltransferase
LTALQQEQQEMMNQISTFDGYVLVVGPVALDIYHSGVAQRLDSTAPVPVVDVQHTMIGAGMAANAANWIAHLGLRAVFVTVVGVDEASRMYRGSACPSALERVTLEDKHYQMAQYHRIYVNDRLQARHNFDAMPKQVVSAAVVDAIDGVLKQHGPPAAVLFSDYERGVCSLPVWQHLEDVCIAKHGVPVVVDTAPANAVKNPKLYNRAHIATPNLAEVLAMEPAANTHVDAALLLCHKRNIENCIVTCGSNGITAVNRAQPPRQFGAIPAHAVDSCGAGDAVAASLTCGVAAGFPLDETIHFATAAGACAVEICGARPAGLQFVHRKWVQSAGVAAKFVDLPYALRLRAACALGNLKVGVANGIFDLLHPGHISLLQQARDVCDFLIVLVNSDESSARIKRPPRYDYATRSMSLAMQDAVDVVMRFDGDTPVPELEQLRPDVWIKGPDYVNNLPPGAAAVRAAGGRIHFAKREYDVSTTKIIESGEVAAKEAASPAAPASSTS